MRRRIVLAVCLCVVVAGVIAASPRARRSSSAQATRPHVRPGVAILKGAQNPQQMPHVRPGVAILKGAQNPQQMMLIHLGDVQPAVWAVNVYSELNLGMDDQQLYQSMASVLTGVVIVPNDRLNYWSAVNNPPNSSISSWYGSVTVVTPDGNGGYLVTVAASPNVTLASGGAVSASLGNYTEQWDIDVNNNATFVQSFDPEGLAGQMPTLMAL
jgi:hypothetical protein